MVIVVVIVRLIKVSRRYDLRTDVAVAMREEDNRCVDMFHKCSKTVVMRYMFVRKSKKVSMRSTKLDI